MVVPRSAPIANAMAVCHSRTPEAPRPMTMPMVAEDEWIIAVMRAAIRAHDTTPMNVVESRDDSTSITAGILRSGLRPPVMRLRP